MTDKMRDDLLDLLNEPHHLGYPVSARTGAYDMDSAMVRRDWYERLMAFRAALAADGIVLVDEQRLAEALANLSGSGGDRWYYWGSEPGGPHTNEEFAHAIIEALRGAK